MKRYEGSIGWVNPTKWADKSTVAEIVGLAEEAWMCL